MLWPSVALKRCANRVQRAAQSLRSAAVHGVLSSHWYLEILKAKRAQDVFLTVIARAVLFRCESHVTQMFTLWYVSSSQSGAASSSVVNHDISPKHECYICQT